MKRTFVRPNKMIRTNKEFSDYLVEFNRREPNNGIAEITFNPSEKIIEQRRNVHSVFIIKSGIAKCYLTEDTGKDFIQGFFGEGQIFGELELLNINLSFCAIEAITEMVVFKIPSSRFYDLLENNNKFNRQVLKLLASKIRFSSLRHSYQQSHPSINNYLRLREMFPELTEKISKRDIANYLGITERSLNRTLNALKEKGLVTYPPIPLVSD